MKNQRFGQILFWTGFLVAVAFSAVVGQGLYSNLRTLSGEELEATIWALDKPVFLLWALSITIGSLLAGIGAFVFVKTRPIFSWIAAIGVFGAVVATVVVWSRVYNSAMYGFGGVTILLSFFAIVWIWMKRHARLDMRNKIAGSYRLIGYIFWINASWFLCGETAKPHLRVFEGSPAPIPFEIMVLLVMGWLFVLLGDYREMRLAKSQARVSTARPEVPGTSVGTSVRRPPLSRQRSISVAVPEERSPIRRNLVLYSLSNRVTGSAKETSKPYGRSVSASSGSVVSRSAETKSVMNCSMVVKCP